MQDDRFDALTRLFGAHRSRRHVIGAGLATIAAAMVGVGSETAVAACHKPCRSVGAPCARGTCCARPDACSTSPCSALKKRGRRAHAVAPALTDGATCQLANGDRGTCVAGVCTRGETPEPGCLAGGETCPMHPISGLADYSACCSGRGLSTPQHPCLCCEPGRVETREFGERCYPSTGNQCCLGMCVPGENSEVGVCG